MSKINFPVTKVCLTGSPKLSVNDREIPAIAYTSYFPQSKYYEQIPKQGLNLFCFPAYLAGRGINIHSGIGPFKKGVWKDDNVFDFSDIVEDFDKILSVVDDPAVIIRLHLDVPLWWEEKYPDQCCIQDDGTTLRQSFSSKKWIEDSKCVLKEIVGWLNDSPYAKYLAGIHIAAGGTEEWVYHYFDRFEDNCKDRIVAYRKWMTEKYNKDFSNAFPADINPGVEFDSHVQDTLKFHACELADRISEFCKTVKQESDGNLLTGAFYGYHNFIFDPRKGHNALGKLLECPYLDYLASPNAYDRSPGKDWPPMVAVDSVKLHGKLWMAENDTRTFLTRPLMETAPEICPEGVYEGGNWKGPESKHISQMLLRNNTARMLTCQYGGWWFDMFGGWFADPDLLAEIKLCQELANLNTDMPFTSLQSEVCVITDEEFLLRDKSFGSLSCEIISQRQALAQAGCAYSMYLRSDLDKIVDKQFKFVWLLGCPDLTENEQNILALMHAAGCGFLHTDAQQSRFLAPSADEWQDACTFTEWSGELLSKLYKECKVHRYINSPDIIYVGNGFLAVHALSQGIKHIQLPEKYTVIDTVTATPLCIKSDNFNLNMQQYDTLLVRVESN